MARNLMAWDPLREMSTMREDMERLFDSMLSRYPRERVQAVWAPPIDVEETNDAMVVRAELPAMKRGEIKVTVAEDTVTISGERKYESEQKNRTFHRVERAYGSFQRTIELPVSVQATRRRPTTRPACLNSFCPKPRESRRARSRSKAKTKPTAFCRVDSPLSAG